MFAINKRMIFGFGTGRCGTKSLAMFLDQQDRITCGHETLISYDPCMNSYFKAVDLMVRDKEEFFCGNVSAAWINYIDRLMVDFPDSCFILLDRFDLEGVIKSFHNYLRIQLKDRKHCWHIYPVHNRIYSKEAVRRAVNRYAFKQHTLLSIFGDKIMHVKTSKLNDRETQDQILDYIGIPVDERVYGMPWRNKKDFMHQEKPGEFAPVEGDDDA